MRTAVRIKNYCKVLFIVLFPLLILRPENIYAQEKGNNRSASLKNKMDKLIVEMQKNKNLASVSAAIIYGDSIIYRNAFGQADKTDSIPANPESVYPIGSITKVFTSVMLMKLIEEGKVNPDDFLNKYIPDYNPKSKYKPHPPTTLRQLASHTSGLPRDAGVNFKMNYSMAEWVLSGGKAALEWYVDKKELLGSVPDIELEYRPAEGKHYSNLGFQLLGAALEKASGMNYIDYISKKIFNPLSLSSMTFSTGSVPEVYRTKGYVFIPQTGMMVEAPEWQLGSALYSGGIYSTASDMARFLTVWFDMNKNKKDNLLSSESLELMCPNGSSGDFYLGWGKGWIDGHTVLSHSGGHIGYIANATVVPELNIGVVVMINTYNPILFNDPAYELSESIVKELYKIVPDMPVLKMESEEADVELSAYEGLYLVSGGTDKIKITVDDNSLKLKVIQNRITELKFFRINNQYFYLDIDPSKSPILKFNFDKKGNVESLNFAMFNFKMIVEN